MSENFKKCKECGKLFAPKGRELYCSDIHYRPCPVCGTPVKVKYFSDPPRKCPECKYRKVKPLSAPLAAKSKSFFNIIPEDGEPCGLAQLKQEMEESNASADSCVEIGWMDQVEVVKPTTIDQTTFCDHVNGSVMVYIGNEHKNGFKPGHKYLLNVARDEYVYMVSSKEDLTVGDSCDIMIPYASQISFYQNFGRVKRTSPGKGHTY